MSWYRCRFFFISLFSLRDTSPPPPFFLVPCFDAKQLRKGWFMSHKFWLGVPLQNEGTSSRACWQKNRSTHRGRGGGGVQAETARTLRLAWRKTSSADVFPQRKQGTHAWHSRPRAETKRCSHIGSPMWPNWPPLHGGADQWGGRGVGGLCNGLKPLHPETKFFFHFIQIFCFISQFLRPKHDCYVKFTSSST